MRSIEEQYLRIISKNLPTTKKKNQFLKDFSESVHSYCAENPSVDIDILLKKFGTPEEIADSFASVQNTPILPSDKTIKNRIILISALALVSVIIILACIKLFSISNDTQNLTLHTSDDVVMTATPPSTTEPKTSEEQSSHNYYENYNIYKKGETITSRHGSPDSPTGIVEYVVKDAFYYSNLDEAGLSQTDLDHIFSSHELSDSMRSGNQRFVIVTISAKNIKSRTNSGSSDSVDTLYTAGTFQLLTYPFLDNNFNYDYSPLVWFDKHSDQSSGSYYLYHLKEGEELEYRIGFLLSDWMKPQDGFLLHIGPDLKSNIYVDLGITAPKGYIYP